MSLLRWCRVPGFTAPSVVFVAALAVGSVNTRSCSRVQTGPPSPPAPERPASEPEPEPPPPAKPKSVAFNLGNEEAVRTPGFTHVPDEQISMFTSDGLHVWMTAGRFSYLFRGPSLDRLTPYSRGRVAYPVLSPGDYDFDRDYAGLGPVLPGYVPGELIGFYHAERHPTPRPAPYIASVGVAVSRDRGVNWQKYGRVLKGRREDAALGASGAGLPSAVLVRTSAEYIYLYYNDWTGRERDAIHLARSLYATSGMPGTWEKYHDGRFEGDGNSPLSDSVIEPPPGGTFAASVNVSYNRHAARFLAVFLSNLGFYFTTSTDGVTWEEGKTLLEVPLSQRDPAGRWTLNYPTLISPAEPSQIYTSSNGFLYYAKRPPGGVHQMYRRPFTIRLVESIQ